MRTIKNASEKDMCYLDKLKDGCFTQSACTGDKTIVILHTNGVLNKNILDRSIPADLLI